MEKINISDKLKKDIIKFLKKTSIIKILSK